MFSTCLHAFIQIFNGCILHVRFRLHNAVQAKQKDKQMLGQLEKRLKAEQEARAAAERQLAEEKKRKKLEEATAARAVALAAASRYASNLFFSVYFVSFSWSIMSFT